MPRPMKCRWVGAEPGVTGFKPRGVPARLLDTIELRIDELEAVRLADREGLYQDEAAARMGISRATFGRLIESARRKIATALLEGKMLVFAGGAVLRYGWRTFACDRCGGTFQAARGTGRPAACPACQGTCIHRIPTNGAPACGHSIRTCARGGRRACSNRALRKSDPPPEETP